jgi:biotin carboxyl carrier protein
VVAAGAVVSPMAGVIKSIPVQQGDDVQIGALLVVLEAMKMENQITAPRAGSVKSIDVAVGQSVAEGEVLLTLQ